MPTIEILDQCLPVTALQFIGDGLLAAGEGSWIDLYDLETERLVHKSQVFAAAVVHGIRCTDDTSGLTCIFGGKNLRILKTHDFNIEYLGEELEFEDWIQDVHWLKHEKDAVAVAFSHNYMICYNTVNRTRLAEIHCEDKCILYSGLIIGESWQHLLLAAGTVFNQIVTWGTKGQETGGCCKVLHRLTGHKGVIFSINFNWEKRLLASVSDDRSLRLWRLVVPSGVSRDDVDWASVMFEAQHELYGHSARVWDCHLLPDNIVTIGEDACCVLWDYEGNLLRRFRGHKGKSIWSLATHSCGIIATGGGDCGVRVRKLTGMDEVVVSSKELECPLTQADFFPRTVRLLDEDNLLIMADDGTLYKHTLSENHWDVLLKEDCYQSYSVLAALPSHRIFAVGNISGKVVLVTPDCHSEYQVFEGKVHSICWLEPEDGSLCMLLSGIHGEMKLYSITSSTDMVLHSQYVLPAAKQRWVTCAVLLHSEAVLVCGDRAGNVHAYVLHQPEPTQTFPKAHGNAGVTDLCFHDNQVWSTGRNGEVKQFGIESGKLTMLHSNRVLKGLQWIAKLHHSSDDLFILGFLSNNFIVYSSGQNQIVMSIPCGGGHRAWDCSFSPHHHVAFYYIKSRSVCVCEAVLQDDQSILRGSLHGREINSIAVITPGRCPIVVTSSEDTTINIMKLHDAVCKSDTWEVLHSLTSHISSVRSVSVCPSQLQGEHSRASLMLTAGGRAQLCAWRVTCAVELRNRSDSLHEMCETGSVEYEYLTTFYLMKNGRRRRKQNDMHPETRIMSVTALPVSEVIQGHIPEVKATLNTERSLYLVAAGCSDGFLRTFMFDESQRTFDPVSQTNFHNHCLLKVGHFVIETANGRKAYMYSVATDGVVAVWDAESLVSTWVQEYDENDESAVNEDKCNFDEPVFSLQAHQSGINSVAICHLRDAEFLLATGGDDNSLTVHKFCISDGQFQVSWKTEDPCAHSAQITGVIFHSADLVMTASIDQRVSVWALNHQLQRVTFVTSKFTNVADVSDMVTVFKSDKEHHIAVTGQGLQMLKFCDTS